MKNKKGFTLVELLATIVIISIIALITTAVILGVIADADKEAFKSSVLGVIDSIDYWLYENDLDEIPDGQCIPLSELDIKNADQFDEESCVKNDNGNVSVIVCNKKYCAAGPKDNLVIVDDRSKLDQTPPNVSLVVNTVTTSKATVTATCSDEESGITKYAFYNGNTLVKEYTTSNTNQAYTYTKLGKESTNNLKVVCTNGAGITNESSGSASTKTVTPTYAVDKAGWATKKIVTITYPTISGETYTKEYRIGTGEWKTASGNTQTVEFTANGSVTARMTDEAGNVFGASTYTVGQVDAEIPKCKIELSGTTGSNSWYTTNVSVKARETSSVTSGTTITLKQGVNVVANPYTHTSNTTELTYTATITSGSGKTNTCSASFKKDSEIPSIEITASDKKISGSWHTSVYSLTAIGSSTVSGTTVYFDANTNGNPITKRTTIATGVGLDSNGSITYYAKACNGAGNCSSNTNYVARLDSCNPSVIITGNGTSNTSYSASDVTLTATSGCSTSGTSYQWYKNGNSISGATNSTYKATSSGTYSVKVTMESGKYATASTNVYIDTCDLSNTVIVLKDWDGKTYKSGDNWNQNSPMYIYDTNYSTCKSYELYVTYNNDSDSKEKYENNEYEVEENKNNGFSIFPNDDNYTINFDLLIKSNNNSSNIITKSFYLTSDSVAPTTTAPSIVAKSLTSVTVTNNQTDNSKDMSTNKTQYKLSSSSSWTTTSATSTNPITITGLQSGLTYDFRTYLCDKVGNCSWSDIQTFTMPSFTQPSFVVYDGSNASIASIKINNYSSINTNDYQYSMITIKGNWYPGAVDENHFTPNLVDNEDGDYITTNNVTYNINAALAYLKGKNNTNLNFLKTDTNGASIKFITSYLGVEKYQTYTISIDSIAPTTTAPSVSATNSTTISVKNNQTDSGSGIGKYYVYYRKKGDSNYTSAGQVTSINSLTPGVTYEVYTNSVDLAGNKSNSAVATVTMPYIWGCNVTNLTYAGYKVTCNVDSSVASVKFPTWTSANGQDDIKWHEATISNGKATYTVKTADHNYEDGAYITHGYAYNSSGNIIDGSGVGVATPTVPSGPYTKYRKYSTYGGGLVWEDSNTINPYVKIATKGDSTILGSSSVTRTSYMTTYQFLNMLGEKADYEQWSYNITKISGALHPLDYDYEFEIDLSTCNSYLYPITGEVCNNSTDSDYYFLQEVNNDYEMSFDYDCYGRSNCLVTLSWITGPPSYPIVIKNVSK